MTNAAERLAHDTRGNYAIMTSLLAVPLLLSAGMAVDYSLIGRARADLQQSLDSAALAVASAGTNISQQKSLQIARNFMQGNFEQKFTKLKVERNGSSVTVRAVTKVPMAFAGVLGYNEWPVRAASTADIAYASYEVALVLDTTGSMAGGKLQSMKDAVIGLVDGMSGQITDKEKLKFAVVPFSSFVNVGPGFGPRFDRIGKQVASTGAAWLDLTGVSPTPQVELEPGASRFQVYRNVGQTWPGCIETRPSTGGLDVSDEAPDPLKPETLYVPAFAIDEPDGRSYANSYIVSDADPFDASVRERKKTQGKYGIATNASAEPLEGGLLADAIAFIAGLLSLPPQPIEIDTGSSGYQHYSKGPSFGCVTQPLLPLGNDYATVKAKVTSLAAQGNTNIMEGVAWGMRVLSPGEPFAQGADRTKKAAVEKIMIVLTDGANTLGNTNNAFKSVYSSYGYLTDGRLGIVDGGPSAANVAMNAKTLAACANAKKDGVEVFTIRLEEPDVKTGTMLAECASDPAHYFDAPSRSQLDEVFKSIADRIVKVRLAS